MNKRRLTRCILSAIMAASVVSYSANVLAADKTEIGQVYQSGDITDSVIVVDDPDINDAEGVSAITLRDKGLVVNTDNVDIKKGSINVENESILNMKNGTIYASPYHVDGKIASDNGITISGGTATFKNMNVNGSIDVGGFEESEGVSTATFTDSNINAKTQYGHGGIRAGIDGKIILEGNGTYQTDEFIGAFKNGSIELNGGTLIADNLRAVTNGSLLKATSTNPDGGMTQNAVDYVKQNIKKGGIVLQNEGVIQTKADQIFERGIDTTSDDTVRASKDSGKVTNDYIDYKGGTLKFTDSKYTQAYLDSAKNNMNAYGGKSQIIMLGTNLDNRKPISVDEAVKKGNSVIEAGDIVKTNENINQLIVGQGTSDNNTQYSNGSFVAPRLVIGKDTSNIQIQNKHSLTLGNNVDGDLISGNQGSLAIDVENGGTLSLGTKNLTEATTKNTLKAQVNVNGGTVVTGGGQNTLNGSLAFSDGNLTVNNNASLNIEKALTATENTKINVGDSIDNKGTAGTLTAEETSLNGATVYLDPVWQDGGRIDEGSKAALVFGREKDNTLNQIDGNLVVGENSTLTLGTTDTSVAQKAFAKTGLTWGNKDNQVLSAVYVKAPQDISKGSLVADKTATADTKATLGNVKFANNSILMVDGSSLGDKAAISGATSVEIAQNSKDKQDGAKLYIDNAENGKSYTIIDNAVAKDSEKWANNNIIADNVLISFTNVDKTNTYTAKYEKVNDVLDHKVSIGNVVDSTLQSTDDKVKAGETYKFFNNAASDHYNTTKASKIDAFNSVANLGQLGGVNHAAYSVSNMFTDSVADHLSIVHHDYEDNDIWAKYIHNKEDISDVKLGGLNADYDASYNGFVVGGDFYNSAKATAGVAFSYVDGSLTGRSAVTSTKNDATFYGLSLYGKIDNGDSALLGDISYLHGSNDLTQYNSGMKITSSPDTDAFSVGLRAEKLLGTDTHKLVPYAGLRYLHLGNGDYTNSLGMKYNVDDQNLVLLPIGIKYSADIKHNNWTTRPIAELGYVWNFGDKDTDQTVSLNGVSDRFNFNTTDDGSFIGKLGIELENDNVVYALGYEYQKGDTVKSNRWMVNATFKF